ncbi:MAG: 4a-hydroxytetrahydrobiopterin dehydratase [Acidimicrobiia bacterium]|nr:4a-hydroxytetrahydrobiopterin dehydratase [Acidimicrobiia bacterium]
MLLDATARSQFLADHPEWALVGETISKVFKLTDFNEAMGFVTRVALAAEVADHHPDIDIRWSKVTIALTTHDAGGLTAKDTELASTIESLVPSP